LAVLGHKRLSYWFLVAEQVHPRVLAARSQLERRKFSSKPLDPAIATILHVFRRAGQ
jgi:hypothetical protein